MNIADHSLNSFEEIRPRHVGGFIDNLYQGWFRDHASVADYLDFYIDGFSLDEIQAMLHEYEALDVDEVRAAESSLPVSRKCSLR